MSRPALEVADIFRDHGAAWRRANAGHVSLDQMKVMSAIERCRTAALGGHVARCEDCTHTVIAYNSCRNRHCPKCQGAAATEWLAAREADLLPVPYFHVVFTLPGAIADIAYQNKAAIYDILFTASAETMIAIAADPKHLGARIGITSVLAHHEFERNLVIAACVESSQLIPIHDEQTAFLAIRGRQRNAIREVTGKQGNASGAQFQVMQVDAIGVRRRKRINHLETSAIQT